MKRISVLLILLAGCNAKTSVLIEILGPSAVRSLELEVQRPDRKITRALIPSPGPSLSLPANVIVLLPDAAMTIDLQLAGLDDANQPVEAHATIQSRPHHQVSVTMTLGDENGDLAPTGDLAGADLTFAPGADLAGIDLRGSSTGDGSTGDMGGVPSLQILAGLPGSNDIDFDGVGRDARLQTPQQPVLIGTSLYFFDYWSSALRKVEVASGVVTTVPLTDSDNGGQALYTQGLVGLAWDGNNKLYASNDQDNTIRVVTLDDGKAKVLVGNATAPAGATDSPPLFNQPQGIAFDGSGNLWVADSNNFTLRKIVLSATPTVTTPAGDPAHQESVNGNGSAGHFTSPRGLSFYNGDLYVTDNTELRKVVVSASPAQVSTIIPDGSWAYAAGVVSAGGGQFYVLDYQLNDLVLVTLPSTQVEVAGRPPMGAGNQFDAVSVDGLGAAARFTDPHWCTLDGAGTMYITENGAVRKVTLSDYTVTTLAGMSAQAGRNDTPDIAGSDETPARFSEPAGLAFDGVDTVYVADYANNRIRTVSLSTGVTGTLAGNGTTDSIDGNGTTTASFGNPAGLARDNAGNLYVADYTTDTVRRIAPNGDVLTIAGIDNSPGAPSPTPTPMPGTSARLNHPDSLEFDGDHTLFLSDPGNNVIRSIDLSSSQFLITTLAGSGTPGTANGVGTAASFAGPHGLAYDANAKMLYVSDYDSNLIRTIDLTNRAAPMVGKLAGADYESNTTDGTFGVARFYAPLGLALDSARGLLWVADTGNNTVRRLDLIHHMTSTPIGMPGVPVTKPGALPGLVHGPWDVLVTPRGLVITSWDENSVLLATGL